MTTTIILTIAILALALLYSSVGHAGASGYLAAMALVGMTADEMRPTALVLNIFVATIGTWRFVRAGHFSWSTLWPFLVTALPLAIFGGTRRPPEYVYKPLVGVVLLWAAVSLIRRALKEKSRTASSDPAPLSPGMPAVPVALLVGAGIGLLAGLTGTGGGIFLSPLLLLLGWASPKRTAAVSVVFVLLVSIAGLIGFVGGHEGVLTAEQQYGLRALPAEIPIYLLAAVVGGTIGSGLGARKLPGESIRLLLGVVLLVASAKMFVTAWPRDGATVGSTAGRWPPQPDAIARRLG